MRSILLAFFVAFSIAADGAVISIDAVHRMVTSSVSGGTPQTHTASGSGTFQNQASTINGSDSGTATALQNTRVLGGEIFSFYSDSDLLASGNRGPGFAPVSLNSESLVEVNFTVPQNAGAFGFWIGGNYTILGDSSDGAPRVAWSLASSGVGATEVFGGSATSGIGVALNEIGAIGPGSYKLSFSAHVGNSGPGGFVGSNAQGAAAFQGLAVIVSPITPVPEPSSACLVFLGGCMFFRRRRS